MILAFMIINNFGKPRLLKFYKQTPEQKQQLIVRELFATLTARAETASSFIDASKWFEPGVRIIYRQYATLYFCMVIDHSESELGILDLVQVLVETLDRHFKSVCELDIIFNSPQVHWVVDEMIVGGLVVETNPAEISKPSTRRRASSGSRAMWVRRRPPRSSGSTRSRARYAARRGHREARRARRESGGPRPGASEGDVSWMLAHSQSATPTGRAQTRRPSPYQPCCLRQPRGIQAAVASEVP